MAITKDLLWQLDYPKGLKARLGLNFVDVEAAAGKQVAKDVNEKLVTGYDMQDSQFEGPHNLVDEGNLATSFKFVKRTVRLAQARVEPRGKHPVKGKSKPINNFGLWRVHLAKGRANYNMLNPYPSALLRRAIAAAQKELNKQLKRKRFRIWKELREVIRGR